MKMQILRVEGLDIACEAMRLSFDSESRRESGVESAGYYLWEDDVQLLRALVAKGDSHAKVTRMISVWMKLTMPRYWWQEFSTYKVGTVEMSGSTVHRLTAREVVQEDFEYPLPEYYINDINILIKEKKMLEAKRRLPESYLQTRIVQLNYQVLRHIYFDRKNHKLPEWRSFLSAMSFLPFYEQFIKVDKALDLSC